MKRRPQARPLHRLHDGPAAWVASAAELLGGVVLVLAAMHLIWRITPW